MNECQTFYLQFNQRSNKNHCYDNYVPEECAFYFPESKKILIFLLVIHQF